MRRRRPARTRRTSRAADELAAALRGSFDHRVDPVAPTSLRSGTPPTVVAETTGTIWSPWPPSTIACTSLTEEPVCQAMNVGKRAVSRMPAIPKTRSFGKPETFFATWHIASSGFETTIRIASGLCAIACSRDGADDLLVRRDEVVAAHAGRARDAGGDHDDVGAGGLLVAVEPVTFGS